MFSTEYVSIDGTLSCKDSNCFIKSIGYKSARVDAICPSLINVGPNSIN